MNRLARPALVVFVRGSGKDYDARERGIPKVATLAFGVFQGGI